MIPFSPCGSVMDFLRFTYKTRMRFGEGMDPVEVQWYQARPGAKPPPFAHRFGARVWENNWRSEVDKGQLGEVYGLYPKWCEPELDLNTCLEGPYWPDKYKPGVPITDVGTFQALRKDAQGRVTGCCRAPEFVPFVDFCDVLPRFTKRVRVTFESEDGSYCTNANGTNVIAVQADDGIWRASTTFGSTGEPIDIDFPFYPNPTSACHMRVVFTDHLPSQVWIRFNQIEEPGWEEFNNPLMIRNMRVSNNQTSGGFHPCGPLSILPEWFTHIRALPDEAE